jgi:hypothetical protein
MSLSAREYGLQSACDALIYRLIGAQTGRHEAYFVFAFLTGEVLIF